MFVLVLFVAIVVFASFAGESQFRLKHHLWKHRLLLVFADSPTSADYLRLRALSESASAGFAERDLLLVPIVPGERERVGHERVDAEAAEALQSRFEIDSGEFTVILVGKDGTEKLRRNSPVAPGEVFGLIDSMPMRRSEMREHAAH